MLDARLICLALAAACGCGSPADYGVFERFDDGDVAYQATSECFLPLSKAPSAVLSQSYAAVAAHGKQICGTCWSTKDVACDGQRVVTLDQLADNSGGYFEVWWFDNQGHVAAYHKRDQGATVNCPQVIYGSVEKYCNPLWGETGDRWYYAEPTCPFAGHIDQSCDVDAGGAAP